MEVTFDAREVQSLFRRYPEAATAKLTSLIEASAVDVQRDMRIAAPVGYSGDLRRAIKYRMNKASLTAEITPDVSYAQGVEEGTRPHWVSVREGSPLRRWAVQKGINPYAVQKSIAKKGTKKHPFVGPTFDKAQNYVPRDVVAGMGKFIDGVNNGRI